MVTVRRFGPLALMVLTFALALSLVAPVQAFRRDPPFLACFAVLGTSPQGTVYAAYFYRKAMATHLAEAWIAAGWTRVIIVAC